MKATADIQGFFRRQTAPVTMGILALIVATSVILFVARSSGELFDVLPGSFHSPWVFLTYPFAEPLDGGYGVIMLLFLGFWLLWVGGATENDLGSPKMGLLWVVATALSGIFVAAGGELLHCPYFATGPLLPVSALTVIWGIRNKTACVRLMMCIPISGYWMAWLTIVIVLADYARTNLILGPIACIPLGIAWAFAAGVLPGLPYRKKSVSTVYKPSKAQLKKEAEFFDDVRKREQERIDRERLRKLFEGSIDES